MQDTIEVRLRYVVTGNVNAVKESITDAFRPGQGNVERVSGVSAQGEYGARLLTVDINPHEVSGYSNYETFTIAMFLENERSGDSARQGPYESCRSLSTEALKKETNTTDPNAHPSAVVWLAYKLEHLVEQTYLRMDSREGSCRTARDILAHSLLRAALDRVDWMELAYLYLNAAKEG